MGARPRFLTSSIILLRIGGLLVFGLDFVLRRSLQKSCSPPPRPPLQIIAMANIPKPGPASLRPGAGLDEWLEEAKQCHYLPESVMKQLCEMVKEVLMEGT